jgi:hypothetical protein
VNLPLAGLDARDRAREEERRRQRLFEIGSFDRTLALAV